MIKVSIILPVVEPLYLVKDCLTSFIKHTQFDFKIEFIIFDSSNENGLLEFINSIKDPRVDFYYIKASYMMLPIETAIYGLKVSQGEYILFLNDDVEIPNDQGHWLNRLIEIYESDTKSGIVTPTLIHRYKTIYWEGAKAVDVPGCHLNMHQPYDFKPKSIIYTPWSNLACGLIKKEYLIKAQLNRVPELMRTVYPHYGTDHTISILLETELGVGGFVCRDTWLYHYNERSISVSKTKHPEIIKTTVPIMVDRIKDRIADRKICEY